MKSPKNNIEKLNISCDNHDCENNLHCFRISKKIAKKQVEGSCFYCGANVVDWIRVRDRRLEDLEFTIENLKKEGIRHYFWHFKLTTKHKEFIRTKSNESLNTTIKKRLLDSIGKEKEKIFRDGIQTPFKSDNPIHAAQHATATCCKKCLNYWYDIPINRKLTDEELEYFTKLIYRYLEIKNDEPDEQKDLFNQE